MIAWTCGALACASLGRHPREILQLVRDWLPIVVVFAAYDLTRGAADSLGIGVHAQAMIDFDRFVFFGETPTEWLQAHLYEPEEVNWWNVAFTLTYTSYFIVPFAVAGLLWVRDRLAFLRYRRRVLTLAFAAVATYVAFPAAPPWMASDVGLLGRGPSHHRGGLGADRREHRRLCSTRARRASTWSPPSPRCTPPSPRWWRCSSGAASALACDRCWRSIRWRWR